MYLKLMWALCGRLWIYLTAEILIGTCIILAGYAAWGKTIVFAGFFMTAFAMFLTSVAAHEKQLFGNIGWLMSLPLAKRQVWLLNYGLKIGTFFFGFALLIAMAYVLPGRNLATGSNTRLYHDLFPPLLASYRNHIAFFLPMIGRQAIQHPNLGGLVILAIGHAYASMTGLTIGRKRSALVAAYVGAVWGGTMLITLWSPSQCTFLLFYASIAVIAALANAAAFLHLRVRDTWSLWPILFGGWALLFIPQFVEAARGYRSGPTMNAFVEGQRFFGDMLHPSPRRLAAAYRMPGSRHAFDSLVAIHTGNQPYYKPSLTASGGAVFALAATLEAQHNTETVLNLLNAIHPDSLNPGHLNAYFDKLAALEASGMDETKKRDGADSSAAGQEAYSNSAAYILDSPRFREELSLPMATIVMTRPRPDDIIRWLKHPSTVARAAATIAARFYPSDRVLQALQAAYPTLATRVKDLARCTLSMVAGRFLTQADLGSIASTTALKTESLAASRQLCTGARRETYCRAVHSCGGYSNGERPECWEREKIDLATLNICLPEFALHGHRSQRAELIAAGWVEGATSHDVAQAILCRTDGGGRDL